MFILSGLMVICLVLNVVTLLLLAKRGDEYESWESDCWTCEWCGFEIHTNTLEGFVEGLRIHEDAVYCPGDEDDTPGHW